MKFIAEDGKVFDTIEECEEYEKKLGVGEMGKAAYILKECVIMLNRFGITVAPKTDLHDNCEQYLTEFEKIMNSEGINGAAYVIVQQRFPDEKIEEALNWFAKYSGISVPHFVGIWRWDGDEWIEYYHEKSNFMHNWEKIESYLM